MGLLDSMINAAVRGMDNQSKLKKSEEKLKVYSNKAEEYDKKLTEQLEEFKKQSLNTCESYERKNIIENVLHFATVERNAILRKYDCFDILPSDYKSSEEYKSVIYHYKEQYYVNLIKFYQEGAPLAYIFYAIRNLQYFDIFKEEIDHLMRHFEYFTNSGKDVKSVFTDSDDIYGKLEEISNTVLTPDEFNKIIEDYDFVDQLKTDFHSEAFKNRLDNKIVEYSNNRKAIEIILHSNDSEEFLERIKMMLIKLATTGENYSEQSQKNEYFKDLIDKIFRPARFIPDADPNDEDDFGGFTKIDLLDDIIADSFRYQRSGMINLINEPLKKFLERFSVSNDENDMKQYETLCNIYQFLKCYDQEKIVLEYMVLNNIPRTRKLEQRLRYLNDTNNIGGGSTNISDAPTEFYIEKEDNQYVYDYRLLSWGESQIRSYFNVLSNENRILETPMVFDDWSNNLTNKGIKWSMDDLKHKIEKSITDNFDDIYQCDILETAPASDGWIDFEESLVITPDISTRYPWIKFIITGEQLTKSQITFSIYVIYDPNYDFKNLNDCYKINKQMGSKLSSLKMKQNPKINNYITTFKEILIKGLEEYLNENISNDSLY